MNCDKKIIRIKSGYCAGRIYFVVACNKRPAPDGAYVMEVVRLRKADYALWRGKAHYTQFWLMPENVEVLNDKDAVTMTEIYSSPKTALLRSTIWR